MTFRAARTPLAVVPALLLLEIFCWIEADLHAPAFPFIRQYFGTTEELVQWTLSLNFLGYFGSSLLVGSLSESLGRRPVILGGSAVFILGSLVCMTAVNMPMLLAGRLLQGLGVSAPTTLAIAVVGDLYPGHQQMRITSIMNSVTTLTMAAAPMAGAWLTLRFGWRSNFLLIFSGALLATLLTLLLVPESLDRTRRRPFRVRTLLGDYGVLLRSRSFLGAGFGLSLLVTPYFIFIATIPFLFQETLRVPVGTYVLLQGAVVGLFAVLSLAVPLLVGRVDHRRMMAWSLAVALGAGMLLALQGLLRPDSAPWITALMCFETVGIVWPMSATHALVFSAHPGMKGSASALLSGSRMAVMAGCIALNARIYDDTFRPVGILILTLLAGGCLLMALALRRQEPV